MRMRVFFGRTPVRRPARMPNAVIAVQRIEANAFFEIAQFAFGAPQFEMIRFIDDGDSSRIVTAIFEFPQSVNDERHNLFVSDVSDYSAHTFIFFKIL
jgi:hypothetical protein